MIPTVAELRKERHREESRERKRRERAPRVLTDADVVHCDGCGCWALRGYICTTCTALHLRLEATR